MSYSKHTWKSEEVIAATKLNNIEQGLADAHDSIAGIDLEGLKGDKGDVGAAGADGQDGADGLSVTALELETTAGAVTGGAATLSDGSTIAITVTGS